MMEQKQLYPKGYHEKVKRYQHKYKLTFDKFTITAGNIPELFYKTLKYRMFWV
jgi:hypothetical protein